ncbi:MAG TPA: hypothetical protein DEV74_04230 [Acidovorax sp.]|nr:hypothetical protein [Acidovorax sp.]
MCAADREGLQGANRSDSRSYCEYLQRGRPPEPADARGAVIRAEGPLMPFLFKHQPISGTVAAATRRWV